MYDRIFRTVAEACGLLLQVARIRQRLEANRWHGAPLFDIEMYVSDYERLLRCALSRDIETSSFLLGHHECVVSTFGFVEVTTPKSFVDGAFHCSLC